MQASTSLRRDLFVPRILSENSARPSAGPCNIATKMKRFSIAIHNMQAALASTALCSGLPLLPREVEVMRQHRLRVIWTAKALYPLLSMVFTVAIGSDLSAQTRTVPLRGQTSRDVHVLSRAGADRVSAAADTVTLKPNQLLVAREKGNFSMTRQSSGAVRLTLPYQISGVDDAGRALDFKLVVDIDRGGMTFVPGAQRFEGRLYVGIIDSHDPTVSRSLPQPISIQVTGQVDQIDPAILQVANSNLPFQSVQLVAIMPPDKVDISFRCSFSQEPTETALTVLRPKLSVTPSPSQIDGLGLQSATITVRAEGFANPGGAIVTLAADRGGLDSTQVKLDSSGTGGTSIRSIGMGKSTITASLPPANPVPTTVTFQTPWVFLFCAVCGGIVGSLIRIFGAGEQAKKSRRKSLVALLAGAMIGLLVAAAYAVGVNLTAIRPTATVGQALVFVIAGVGAYVGKIFIPK